MEGLFKSFNLNFMDDDVTTLGCQCVPGQQESNHQPSWSRWHKENFLPSSNLSKAETETEVWDQLFLQVDEWSG